eukprot:TRINITY_DN14866_c0_g1_i1.p1 TRINITY_DN14866_c0_g1~~TRINITY_DN14866_c0_g1_i1.p1  ORF type:complete len:561 (+),score=100.14 TRINITY_DN14866_c0_g1_i1:25-1683(+)
MKLVPDHEWEDCVESIRVVVKLPRVAKDAIDVYLVDAFAKVNAERYLWACDLFGEIVLDRSTYRIDDDGVHFNLAKLDATTVWPTLSTNLAKDEAIRRREASIALYEQQYRSKIEQRKQHKKQEEHRYFEEHWDLEKQQRKDIEQKMQAERDEETTKLAEFEKAVAAEPRGKGSGLNYGDSTPEVRHTTTVIPIEFTPTIGQAPARAAHDSEYYHSSQYRPRNPEDTPIFFKERADKLYHSRQWRAAADMYSEALKRDPAYMQCIVNRSACWLQLHRYDKCLEDSSLALGMIQNTPSCATTGDRYRYDMMRVLVRRGTARAWSGDIAGAIEDYRSALAYRTSDTADIATDLHLLEAAAKDRGIVIMKEATPAEKAKAEADRLLQLSEFTAALENYNKSLELDFSNIYCHANRAVCLLQLKRFNEAITDCDWVIQRCEEVACALNETQADPSAERGNDSDDEESQDPSVGERVRSRRAKNSDIIKQNTSNVISLLKAYVRKGCALCGLGHYPDAAAFYGKALAITPYDDDLRRDCESIMEKARITLLTQATQV